MATRRKAHPDHYQTQPGPTLDEGLYSRERRRLRAAFADLLSRPTTAAPPRIHVGEHLRRPRLLRCEQCGEARPFLAGQRVEACRNCGAALFAPPT